MYRRKVGQIAGIEYTYPSFLTVCSQTCVQRLPLGPEKCDGYAEGYMKKISGE
jgi:hypothetical protein